MYCAIKKSLSNPTAETLSWTGTVTGCGQYLSGDERGRMMQLVKRLCKNDPHMFLAVCNHKFDILLLPLRVAEGCGANASHKSNTFPQHTHVMERELLLPKFAPGIVRLNMIAVGRTLVQRSSGLRPSAPKGISVSSTRQSPHPNFSTLLRCPPLSSAFLRSRLKTPKATPQEYYIHHHSLQVISMEHGRITVNHFTMPPAFTFVDIITSSLCRVAISRRPTNSRTHEDICRLCDEATLISATQPPGYDSQPCNAVGDASQTVTSWSYQSLIGGRSLGLGLPLSAVRSNVIRSKSIREPGPHGAAQVLEFLVSFRSYRMSRAAVSAWALRRKLLWLVVKRHAARLGRVVE